MFEFAISQQQRRKPTRRFIASVIVSLCTHGVILMILLEHPHLLESGVSRWFRVQLLAPASDDRNWRPVTTITSSPERMLLPPAEVLRRVIYDWERAKSESEQPSFRLSWNAQQLEALAEQAAVTPPTKPVPGTEEPAPLPSATTGPPAPSTGPETGGTRTGSVYLPQPAEPERPAGAPDKVAEVPGAIPSGIKPVPDEKPAPGETANAKSAQAQVFKDQQSAIRAEGSGLFDTKGFPMGDYATSIIEKVKSNWLIPSNLRNSQGRTTIIFFIARDGRFMDARIIVPSGSSSLDLAALSAVIGSNPFPPLPEGFPTDRVGAKFVFSYNERP